MRRCKAFSSLQPRQRCMDQAALGYHPMHHHSNSSRASMGPHMGKQARAPIMHLQPVFSMRSKCGPAFIT